MTGLGGKIICNGGVLMHNALKRKTLIPPNDNHTYNIISSPFFPVTSKEKRWLGEF
jgi:hypothetical protein